MEDPPASGSPAASAHHNTRLQKSKDKYFKQTGHHISSYEKAVMHLRTSNLILLTEQPELNSLISGLFYLASQVKEKGTKFPASSLIDSLRAFAFYADTIRASEVGKVVGEIAAKCFLISEDEHKDRLAVLADMQEERLMKAAEQLNSMMECSKQVSIDLREERDKLIRELMKVVTSVENMKSAGKEVLSSLEEGVKKGASQYSPPSSYAAAAGSSLPLSHASMLVREDARAKEIFVDSLTLVTGDSFIQEDAIVKKGEIALELLGEGGYEDSLEGMCIVAARKLRNGGIVFELNSAD